MAPETNTTTTSTFHRPASAHPFYAQATRPPFVFPKTRPVQLYDNVSLYLSLLMLRNAFHQQTQPRYLDAAKSLPKPLPVVAEVESPPDKKEGDKEEEEEDGGSSENLSAEELLQIHIKRAKKIRSWLREERLGRMTRYKTRLALLLPPI